MRKRHAKLCRSLAAWFGVTALAFKAAEMTQDYARFAVTWPGPVREHWKLYWWAWLMPDCDFKDSVQGYIGGQQHQDYIKRTSDWRGIAYLLSMTAPSTSSTRSRSGAR